MYYLQNVFKNIGKIGCPEPSPPWARGVPVVSYIPIQKINIPVLDIKNVNIPETSFDIGCSKPRIQLNKTTLARPNRLEELLPQKRDSIQYRLSWIRT